MLPSRRNYAGRGVNLGRRGGWAFRTAPDLAGQDCGSSEGFTRKLSRAAVETPCRHSPITSR